MDMFDKRFQIWLEGAQKIVDDYYRTAFPRIYFEHKKILIVDRGRRYIKMSLIQGGRQKAVFAFIDMTNGDVLKAATWRRPAKKARGNIFNQDDGLGCVDPYGIKYLR